MPAAAAAAAHLTSVEMGLYVADAAWSLFVVFPVLTIYWSGTWALVDHYADLSFPNQAVLGSCVCFVVGSWVLIAAYFLLPLLRGLISDVSFRSLSHVLVSRVLVYCCALGALLFWRGAWNLAVLLVGSNVLVVTGVTVTSLVALALLRASSGPIGSPFSLQLDTTGDFYDAVPRFRQQMDNFWFYTMDVSFTVYVIMTLNVIVWVGLWALGDRIIFPHDPQLSLFVSLAAGYGCSLVIFGLWFPIRSAHVRLAVRHRWLGHLVDALYNVVCAVVVLLLWRGLWGLMQNYMARIPDLVVVAWLCHGLGFAVMIALQVGRTFGGVGCVVDGERSDSDGRQWPMAYFIVYYRHRQGQGIPYVHYDEVYAGEETNSEAARQILSSTSINYDSMAQA